MDFGANNKVLSTSQKRIMRVSAVRRQERDTPMHLMALATLHNEQISQNPRRVAHCRVSSLVMVCRRSFAAKASLLAI